MPRNGSGTYSLPSGNPVVTGTVIDATWANDTLEDIANELTNSLSRTGAGGMLAPFRFADGTVTSPGLAFLNETNTGIYRSGAGEVWFTVGGVAVAQITANGILLPSGKNITAQGNVSVGGTLDMTDGLINNVATPVSATDAATKQYVDDRVDPVIQYADYYLGPKASDPALNNSGGALTEGSTYWNTTSDQMRVYNGSNWEPMPSTAFLVGQTFSGDAVETDFTLADASGPTVNLEVFISGVRQVPTTDYTVSGTTLTFTVAPPTGADNIFVRFAQLVQTPNTTDASLVKYTPAGTGAVATNVQSKLRETVSVKDFGAVGDGVTDDTAAIQAANDNGSPIHFSAGTYKCTALTMSVSWSMAEGATLLFAGTTGQTVVTCSGSGLTGNLNIDCGDLAPAAGLLISGNNNRLTVVRVKRIKSPVGSGTNTGVSISGNNNTINKIVATDQANTGNTNDSMPQALVTSGAADENIVSEFIAQGIQSGITTASTGLLSVGTALLNDVIDNGLYVLPSSFLDVGTIEYLGDDEPIVNRGTLTVGTAIISRAGNAAIGVQNATNTKIGTLILRNNGVSSIIKTRTGNSASGPVWIGQVFGEMTGDTFANLSIGTVDYFTVTNVNIDYDWDPSVSGVISSFCNLDGCLGFSIQNWNIKVIDTTGDTVSGNFEIVLPADSGNLAKVSFAKWLDVQILQSDEITPSTAGFLRISRLAQTLVMTEGIRFQANIGPYGREVNYSEPGTSNVTPAVGTWRVGQRLQNRAPTVGQPKAWVCTVAGTPGTWVSEGNL